MHCIFRVISQDDFGIDGEIEIITAKPDGVGFQTSGGIIKVQAKSGASYVKKDSATSFSAPVRKDDLDYWNGCTFPVFFIVYSPNDDALYFKEVKSYIRDTPDVFRPPLEVVFQKPRRPFHSQLQGSRLSTRRREPAPDFLQRAGTAFSRISCRSNNFLKHSPSPRLVGHHSNE